MYGSLWKTLKNEPLVAKVFLIQPRTSCLNFQYCVDFRDVLNCWWIQLVLYRSVMPRAYWTCRTGRAAGEIGKFWGSVWEVFVYVCIFLRKRKRFRWLIGWPGWLHVYSSFFFTFWRSPRTPVDGTPQFYGTRVRISDCEIRQWIVKSFCALRTVRTPAKIMYSSRIRHMSLSISSGEYVVD